VHPKVTAPWEIPAHEAHSFLTGPTRNKKNDTKCNTRATMALIAIYDHFNLSVTDESYSRNAPYALHSISRNVLHKFQL
jgi:hypothetical protein